MPSSPKGGSGRNQLATSPERVGRGGGGGGGGKKERKEIPQGLREKGRKVAGYEEGLSNKEEKGGGEPTQGHKIRYTHTTVGCREIATFCLICLIGKIGLIGLLGKLDKM